MFHWSCPGYKRDNVSSGSEISNLRSQIISFSNLNLKSQISIQISNLRPQISQISNLRSLRLVLTAKLTSATRAPASLAHSPPVRRAGFDLKCTSRRLLAPELSKQNSPYLSRL